MNKKEYLLKARVLLIGLMFVNIAFGQTGAEDGSKYGKGQDSIDCLTNISLYSEYVNQKAYADAAPFWRECFNNCPQSTKNIYIDGAKIYLSLHKKELDGSKKDLYADTVMMIYEKRIEYGFGEEAKIRQYQAINLFNLRNDDPESLKKVYDYYKIALEGLGTKAIKPVFMNFTKVGGMVYNNTLIDAETLINDYLMLLDILEEKGDAALINGANKDMIEIGVLNCEELIKIYEPKFAESPEDLRLLSMITKFMDKTGCQEEELYYKALSNQHKLEPTATSAQRLAKLAMQKSKYDDAIKYSEEALSLATDNDTKAALYLDLARATHKKGNKPKAREHALKSASLDPTSGEPYLLIGIMYSESNEECNDASKYPNGVVYWAAVDKFVKAKSIDSNLSERANKYIETYSKYFPNKEDAFMFSVHEGSTYKVQCWINETTKARFSN